MKRHQVKSQYVKATALDLSFDCPMEFLKSARKVVTPLRNAIDDLNLTLDKHFDQINSIPPELISVIGLLIENNKCITTYSNYC